MYNRLLVLALGTFAVGTDSFVVAGILPDVAKDLSVSESAAGQLVTVFALSYAVLSPVLAAVTAHWPRKRLLLGGLFVLALGNALTALLPTFGLVLASRVVAGLGAAMFTPTASVTASTIASPEKRGKALAIVMAGLSGATALGAPIGTVIGSQTSWRTTMWFVVGLTALAGAGVALMLRDIPSLPPIRLAQRLKPLADSRIQFTLLTTVLVLMGLYTVYTYIATSFDRATDGSGTTLAVLLFIWGAAATLGNLVGGSLTDKLGSRTVVNTAITLAAIDFVLLPLSSKNTVTAAVALVVWGLCGWGVLVPQQHRLIQINPAGAPLSIALNAAALYLGVSASGGIGAAGISLFGAYNLGLVGAVFIVLGLGTAEIARALISRRAAPAQQQPAPVVQART